MVFCKMVLVQTLYLYLPTKSPAIHFCCWLTLANWLPSPILFSHPNFWCDRHFVQKSAFIRRLSIHTCRRVQVWMRVPFPFSSLFLLLDLSSFLTASPVCICTRDMKQNDPSKLAASMQRSWVESQKLRSKTGRTMGLPWQIVKKALRLQFRSVMSWWIQMKELSLSIWLKAFWCFASEGCGYEGETGTQMQPRPPFPVQPHVCNIVMWGKKLSVLQRLVHRGSSLVQASGRDKERVYV